MSSNGLSTPKGCNFLGLQRSDDGLRQIGQVFVTSNGGRMVQREWEGSRSAIFTMLAFVLAGQPSKVAPKAFNSG